MPPWAAVAAASVAAAAASGGSASTTVASRARLDPIILCSSMASSWCNASGAMAPPRAIRSAHRTGLQRPEFLVQRRVHRAGPEIGRAQGRHLDLGLQQGLLPAQDALGEHHAGAAEPGHFRGYLEQVVQPRRAQEV